MGETRGFEPRPKPSEGLVLPSYLTGVESQGVSWDECYVWALNTGRSTPRVDKRLQIAQTHRETKERRKNQVCRVFTLKVDESRNSLETKGVLGRLFLEAKWLRNHCVAEGPFNTDYRLQEVPVKVGDRFEKREIKALSSQMRQSIVDQVKQDVYNLSRAKAKGMNVGKLRFAGFVGSIPLKQHDVTYKILDKKTVHIQGIKQSLKVHGMEQVPGGAEFANAFLVKDYGRLYVKIVTYSAMKKKTANGRAIGVDLGIKNQLTFSNGVRVNYEVLPTERLRRLYQRLSRQTKQSKKWTMTVLAIQAEFSHLTNRKADIRNKLSSFVAERYEFVAVQDDCIKGWQRIWGKMMSTALGGLADALVRRASTPMEVDRFFASTKACHRCKHINGAMRLDERTFRCEVCGLVMDRDLNAALNILSEGLKQKPVERRLQPVETGASTGTLAMLRYFNSVPRVKASLVNESGSPAGRGEAHGFSCG